MKQEINFPKVSIVIVNWNGLQDTIECLGSLKNITYPNYSVIVVDNGSQGNDAQELKQQYGTYIHLLQNDKNYGFAGGVNVGITYAMENSQTDYVLLLNNDTVVDPGFLAEMVNVADSEPAIGIGGAKIFYYDEPEQLQSVYCRVNLLTGQPIQTPLIISNNIRHIETDHGQYDSIKVADYVSGCCFLIKRRVAEKIGLLDEKYFCYWEEADYCYRARKAGFKIVYVHRAKIWHKHARAVNRVAGFSLYYMTRNRFLFMKKQADGWQYCVFLIYFFGLYFWLATAYYLIFHHNLNLLHTFCRGVRDGLFDQGTKI